jgi:hypothetical protein
MQRLVLVLVILVGLLMMCGRASVHAQSQRGQIEEAGYRTEVFLVQRGYVFQWGLAVIHDDGTYRLTIAMRGKIKRALARQAMRRGKRLLDPIGIDYASQIRVTRRGDTRLIATGCLYGHRCHRNQRG